MEWMVVVAVCALRRIESIRTSHQHNRLAGIPIPSGGELHTTMYVFMFEQCLESRLFCSIFPPREESSTYVLPWHNEEILSHPELVELT